MISACVSVMKIAQPGLKIKVARQGLVLVSQTVPDPQLSLSSSAILGTMGARTFSESSAE